MIKRIGLRWRLVGLLAAVLVIVALPYAVTRSSTDDALAARDWVTHSADIKASVYRLDAILRSSEAAIYARLAGAPDEPVLQERALGPRQNAPEILATLRTMMRDNAEQLTRLGAIDSITNGRIVLTDQALQRLKAGDRDGAFASMEDARQLFPFREQVKQLLEEESRLLSTRRADAEGLASNNRSVLLVAALAQILLLGIVVVVSERQIAIRLAAESKVAQAVQRSQLIVQAVREPIAMLDGDLRALLVNTAFAELYGSDPESRKNTPLNEIGDGAWKDTALLQRLSDVIARDRELWDYELTQRTVDGIDRFVVINARRIEQPDNDEPALLLTVSDITARALVEQKVTELNRQLEGKVEQISDVNRELEAFSYSVSHDLRAPLRHISGFASKLELQLGDQVDDRVRHYIDVISTSSRRMAQLIDDLLVFSRLGRGALRLQPVDMQSLVEEARALVETDIRDRRIEWRVAPLPIVVGDENMLRTVWQNLLGNAVKYTGNREIAKIEVGLDRTSSGDYEFFVRDNGAGFDMQYAGKLFGVFQRLHRASEFPGNGIGLANVRRIVARHGGRTWAEGETDRGATFHFSLPASDLPGARTGDS
ncbi:PAS domain-containing protein [Luteibacter anthropi]|uniref:histidine kinase n=1 Tax=Luteibacter anthropi TaxID=564369 RepID=A0A7X5U9H8_9GAMM|nr:ATP-binding protein [Luteibacter anthropi]NII06375.1 PAS domain-containing protein [Luteibacter anthropi]URX64486.1 PAS domain-containing protein [Luteibacter anthropi]